MIEKWQKCIELIDRIERNRLKVSEMVNTIYPIQKKNFNALMTGKATEKDILEVEYVLDKYEGSKVDESDNLVIPRTRKIALRNAGKRPDYIFKR